MSAYAYIQNKYKDHPKVVQARKLLLEAEQDLRAEWNDKRSKDVCECGHVRNSHGPSYSINYTQGVCKVQGCKCMHFLIVKVIQ